MGLQLRVLTQGTAEVGHRQHIHQPVGGPALTQREYPAGIAFPQGGQGGTAGGLPQEHGILNGDPCKLFVKRLVHAALKAAQQGGEDFLPEVLPGGADDAVPV